MRNIDNKRCTKFMAKRLHRFDIGRVRIHREQAFGDNKNAVLRIARPDFFEFLAHRINTVVPEQVDIAGRGLRAFLKTGMAQCIHDNMVARADKPLDDAEPGGPAGREQGDMIGFKEIGDRRFEFDRQ